MISTQNSRLIGYARVSTNDQELNLQVDALLAHGVTKEHLFFDKLSGAREDRPGLLACNEVLRRGDTLVVWRLDRLGRSMRHLVNMIEDLKENWYWLSIHFRWHDRHDFGLRRTGSQHLLCASSI